MHTNVIFRYSAPFVTVTEEGGILSASGVDWFVRMLERLPEIAVDREPCQEDWGVVIFTRRRGRKFWVGLGAWPDRDQEWLAHFHHGSFAWLQRLSHSGKRELRQLIYDTHAMLVGDPAVAVIGWYSEVEILKADAVGSPAPDQS